MANPETCLHNLLTQAVVYDGPGFKFFVICLSCEATIDIEWVRENIKNYHYDIDYNNVYPICPEEDCEGDARYSAPGRGHKKGCAYPNVYPICPEEGCEGDARYSAPGRGHKKGCAYPNG